jgi:hypothetical protein
VAYTTGEVDPVCLELHAGTATVTEAPAREVGLNVLNQQGHTSGETLQHTDKFRAV